VRIKQYDKTFKGVMFAFLIKSVSKILLQNSMIIIALYLDGATNTINTDIILYTEAVINLCRYILKNTVSRILKKKMRTDVFIIVHFFIRICKIFIDNKIAKKSGN